MKKLILLFCVAMLALPAASAFAQLDVTWDNCVVTSPNDALPPANNKTFSCSSNFPPAQWLLYGCFKVPEDLPGFFAMDISMDFSNDTNTPLTPFWHFEAGGCNNDGVSLGPINYFVTTNECLELGANNGTPWGLDGSAAVGGGALPGYAPDYLGIQGRGRALAGMARSSTNPFPLVANKNYIAFQMSFKNTNVLSCTGCSDNMVIVWNSATLYSNDGHPPVVLTGPDKKDFYSCGLINGAGIGTCAATPTRNTTWGQLKSIYR